MNRLAAACLSNAEHLIRAAKSLFDSKFYGYSAALAALAIEECSKGFVCGLSNDLWKDFPKDYRSHSKKLHWAGKFNFFEELTRRGLFSISNPVTLEEYQAKCLEYFREKNKDFLEILAESIAYTRLHDVKMTGLYVDVKAGKLSTPRKIKRKESAFVIKLAEKRIDAVRKELQSVRYFE